MSTRSVWSNIRIRTILSKLSTMTKWICELTKQNMINQIGIIQWAGTHTHEWCCCCCWRRHVGLWLLMFAIKYTAGLLHSRSNMFSIFFPQKFSSTFFLLLHHCLCIPPFFLCAIHCCIHFILRICSLLSLSVSFAFKLLDWTKPWHRESTKTYNSHYSNMHFVRFDLVFVFVFVPFSFIYLYIEFYSFFNAELFTLSQQQQLQLVAWLNYALYVCVALYTSMRILCVRAQT